MESNPVDAESVCREQERATLERIAATRERPRAMAEFDRFFLEGVRRQELSRPHGPVVGQLCAFAPEELVWALGGVSLRLESGCANAARLGEHRVGPDCCPAARSAAGLLGENLWPFSSVDLLVMAASCDPKTRLSELSAAQREVFVLHPPRNRRDAAAKLGWLGEIERLRRRLEALCGRRLGRRALGEAIALFNRRVALVRAIDELRRLPVVPLSGSDALLCVQSAFHADPHWWIERTEALVAELAERARAGKGVRPALRILLTGSPVLWPDFRLPLLLAEAGAEVVAEEMCTGGEALRHPTVVDERTTGGLVRAAAERVLLPSGCPCFAEREGRLDRLLELAESHRVDAVVHHTLRMCQLVAMDAPRLVQALRRHNIPTLELTTELGPEDAGRLRNRIEALVETLRGGGQDLSTEPPAEDDQGRGR